MMTAELPKASQQAGYYEFERPEVIALIPESAKRVLEFGCASGACGARIKRERGARVVGVELMPGPAEIARERLDRVLIGDCETMDFSAHFEPGEFDAILFADVLEHLRDPDAVLKKLEPFLAPDGVIIISLPNARNLSVVAMLAGGDFTYQEAGLLDRTHLRFFTRREIQRMFGRVGFRIDSMRYVHDANFAQWNNAGRPAVVNAARINIQTTSPEDAEELFVYQFLVRANRAPALPFANTARPRVSVVIPVRNQLPFTEACIESLRAHTPDPREIILVDNASDDGTPLWARDQPDVTHIPNDANRGFAAACNQGLAVASGDYVVLLNNDTIVPEGWIDRLLAPMVRDREIGLTGPRSNWVFSLQLCREATYGQDIAAMHRFAADWQLRHQATGFPVGKLVGFCIAIRREVIDKIGGLDERFGVGNFEDDDYCVRAMLAGYRCWVANDCFVHHWGSQTFKSEHVNFQKLMTANWSIYAEKWGIPSTVSPTSGYDVQTLLDREASLDELRIPLPPRT